MHRQPGGQDGEGPVHGFPGLQLPVLNAQLREDPLRRPGHDKADADRDPADALRQRVQHGTQPGPAFLALAQHPGLRLIDIPVALADQLPDFLQRAGELEGVHLLLHLSGHGFRHRPEAPVQILHGADFGDASPVVFLDHGDRPAHQIAQVVGQVGVDPGQHRLQRELAVIAEGHLPHQEIAHRVAGIPAAQHHRIHHVAHGLAHLLPVDDQPAVPENLLGQRESQRVEHDGPVDRVETDDLLPDQMHVRRPVFPIQPVVIRAVSQRRDVIAQRVNPDVDRMLGIKVHGNAPLDAGPADAQILESGLQEVVDHLVGAAGGLDEIRVLLDVPDQPGSVLVHPEEIALLLRLLHGAAAVRAAPVLQLQLRPEALAGRAVPALVFRLVNVALVVQLAEDLLHRLDMAVVRGADEIVVLDVHQLPQVLDPGDNPVHILLGRLSQGLRLLLDLLAVLIGSGQEKHVVSRQLLEPGHGVRRRGAVGVPDVQIVGGIVDRRGDVERLFSVGAGHDSPLPSESFSFPRGMSPRFFEKKGCCDATALRFSPSY